MSQRAERRGPRLGVDVPEGSITWPGRLDRRAGGAHLMDDEANPAPSGAPKKGNALELREVLDLVGLVVAPTSVTGALYWTGWKRTEAYWSAFGVDQSLLRYSTTDYVVRNGEDSETVLVPSDPFVHRFPAGRVAGEGPLGTWYQVETSDARSRRTVGDPICLREP